MLRETDAFVVVVVSVGRRTPAHLSSQRRLNSSWFERAIQLLQVRAASQTLRGNAPCMYRTVVWIICYLLLIISGVAQAWDECYC